LVIDVIAMTGRVSCVWQVVKPLRPHPLSVGQARNFCTRRLTSVLDDRCADPEVVSDAATIASELVTNALTAGSTEISLSLALRPDSVYIEVEDDAAGTVTPANPAPTDPKGRGLMVVAALSREWGVSPIEGGAKHVWAEVALHNHEPDGHSAAQPVRRDDNVS
jgi:anti-sigma regulatory factor (Ser/Thr protein kinase)